MILTTAIATVMGLGLMGQESKPLACPIMGGEAKVDGPKSEYNGVVVGYCCGGCDAKFTADPVASFKKAKESGNTIGEFLFDPVSGKRIKATASKAKEDFAGVRYYFESEANKKAFDANKTKFAVITKKEVLVCPVSGEKIEHISDAAMFKDVNGTRYYTCCGNCSGPMTKDAAAAVAKCAKTATAPKVAPAPSK